MQNRITGSILLTLVLGVGLASADQLPQVKELYNAAEYDRVLGLVRDAETASGPGLSVELREYRALSLLALSRTAEAEQAIAAIFAADPFYAPAATASPRWKSTVDKVRARVRPEIIRNRYTVAKQHYDARDFKNASAEFEVLKRLLAAAKAEGMQGMDDLVTLTDGFLQLSRTAGAPPTPEPAAPAASPAAPVAVAPTVVKPPVAVRRSFPRWDPPSFVDTRQAYSGRIAVMVAADGSVSSVRIVDSVHSTYDSVLVAAAKKWRFEPATRDGKPIAFEVEVPVELTPGKTADR